MTPLRIAVPKGRLQEKVLAVFAAAGYPVPTAEELKSRKLVFHTEGPGVSASSEGPTRDPGPDSRDLLEWIFVKDCDVPVYVEHGAADAGVAGLDQILEHDCTAYQPVEFDFGRCRMMLIGGPGAPALAKEKTATVATKYPRIARQYLDRVGVRAEIIPLGGSVELAAVLDLTSHVVDLVETGETARVHRLEMQDVVAEISPRLIVSRNAYRTDTERVRDLIRRIEAAKDQVPGAGSRVPDGGRTSPLNPGPGTQDPGPEGVSS